jgi:hypothetical protein
MVQMRPLRPLLRPGLLGTALADNGQALPLDQQWANAAKANGGAPSAADQAAIAAFIQGCKDDGFWNQLSVIRLWSTDSLGTDCINIKDPQRNRAAITNTAPTKTPYRSATGSGAGAIDENFNPALDSRYTLSDASYWVWSLTEAQSNTSDIGNTNNRGNLKNTSNQVFARVNDATNDTNVPGTSIGFFGFQRVGGTKKYWLNGASIFTVARAATSITNGTVYLFGVSPAGGCTREFTFSAWGASLNGFENAFYLRVKALLTAFTGLTDFNGQTYSVYEGDDFEMQLAQAGGDVTYTLLAGQDSAKFSITNNTLKLPAKVYAAPTDFDTNNSYIAALRSTRASTGATVDSTITVNVKQEVVGTLKRYIKPAATGTGDGSTLANAAAFSSLDTLVTQVGPGGTVYLIADLGNFVTQRATLSHGGSKNNPVTICGVDSGLNPMNAVFVGSRTAFVPPADPQQKTDVTGWATGSDMFILAAGADNIKFKNIAPQNTGSFISCTASVHGLEINTVTATNCLRFFEMGNNLCVGAKFKDVTVNGYSKQCIRYRGTSHDWNFDNVQLDSMRQNGDNFGVGVQMSEYASNPTAINSSFKNAYDDTNSFWNGDGWSSEATCFGTFNFTNCTFSGNTDAGLDLKAAVGSQINITGCTFQDNKNNIKLWGNSSGPAGSATFTLSGVVSIEPNRRGGGGAPNHVDGANGAAIIIKGTSSFSDTINGGGGLYVMENNAGAYHVAVDTVESSVKPRTVFVSGTTIDTVIP